MNFTGTLGDEITNFGSISALDGQSSTNNRKRKVAAKKKRGGKKRKFH